MGHDTLEIRLGNYAGKSLHLYVGDELKAEITCGMVQSERDWLAEIGSARAAKTGLRFLREALKELDLAVSKPDGHGSSEKDRLAAFADGFRCGLLGEKREVENAGGGVIVLPPAWAKGGKGGQSFESGWRLGMAIVRATSFALENAPTTKES